MAASLRSGFGLVGTRPPPLPTTSRTEPPRPAVVCAQLVHFASGYDAVVGEPGTSLNHDECVVYDERAAIPSYLIAYSVPDVHDK